MKRQRRNGSDYHVLGARAYEWAGAEATPDVRHGYPCTLSYPTHQSADEVAAGIIGEGYFNWSIVTDPEHMPISYAKLDGDMVVLTAAERYGVYEEEMFENLCRKGEGPASLRRLREAALAKGPHTPAEREYTDALVTQWTDAVLRGRLGQFGTNTAHLGFYGPTFEYHKVGNGYEMADPVSLGTQEVLFVFLDKASIRTLCYLRTLNYVEDNYISAVSKEVFKKAWYAAMGIS